METFTIKGKEIFIGDFKVQELAEKYGTPTYIYNEQRIRENFRRAFSAFSSCYPDFKFFYAVKACNNPAIVSILKQEGAGIDAASVNEILLAKRLGLDGENVMFSGNFLSDEDIQEGLESGVIFNLDDVSLLPRVLKYRTPEILSFRVNPGYGKSNVGDFVTNAGPKAKFGIHPDLVTEAYRKAKAAGIKRFGVHMMPGSCVTDSEYFAFVTDLLMEIVGKSAKELKIEFEFVNIGGGLGIPYKENESHLDIEKTAELVATTFKESVKKYGMTPPKLMMEPGRYFVGDAGIVLGKVHAIKDSYSKIIGTDIGMNVLVRPAFYGAYHKIFFNGRIGDPMEVCGLCGQLCENSDFWVKEREFPKTVNEGDLVVVTDAGAYGFGMSYQYNGRLRPAEVLVNGKDIHLIRKRETFEDMIKNTIMTTGLKKIIESALSKSNEVQDKESLRLELEILLSSLLQISRIDIYLKEQLALTDTQIKEIEAKISRLIKGEPLCYIIGYAQFRNIKLKTGPGVLIPRPETEQIIDIAARYIKDNSLIIDVGTGTGAIALSIAKEFPKTKVTGVDVSNEALRYAIENKEINKIENVIFKINDLCSGFSSNSFDIIIANLPYISEEEYSKLPSSVSCFEPKLALTPGKTGLELIERLADQSKRVLKPNGSLILEIGYNQGPLVKKILNNANCFKKIEILTDYKNLDRFAIGEKLANTN